ncbi:unnamed protein product [Rangifer tarandus platyrhynchus]|uniref:Uncharacterized protein n=1 Tax=Rangifer tarandus platyrhynchus TaxID=3082113 RepID=A0AC59YHQ0_RANTA
MPGPHLKKPAEPHAARPSVCAPVPTTHASWQTMPGPACPLHSLPHTHDLQMSPSSLKLGMLSVELCFTCYFRLSLSLCNYFKHKRRIQLKWPMNPKPDNSC